MSDGIASAMAQAKAVSGDQIVMVHGADTAQIVLADGWTVDCDDYREPELFWALRGRVMHLRYRVQGTSRHLSKKHQSGDHIKPRPRDGHAAARPNLTAPARQIALKLTSTAAVGNPYRHPANRPRQSAHNDLLGPGAGDDARPARTGACGSPEKWTSTPPAVEPVLLGSRALSARRQGGCRLAD